MDLLVIVGGHPRHRALVNQVAATGTLAGVITQKRETHVPDPPERLDESLTELFEMHFERRRHAEIEFFEDDDLAQSVPSIQITPEELNSNRLLSFVKNVDPNLTITYGIDIIEDEVLAGIPGDIWNVHAGLSPEYRGVITHFWPSYHLEPQMTGVTLHELTADIDGGPIVHQTGAPLVRGDGLHQLACRTMQEFFSELSEVIELYRSGNMSAPTPQKRAGKLWTSSDWRPEHLKLIYGVYDNDIVDHYLDGEFDQVEPDLVRQPDI